MLETVRRAVPLPTLPLESVAAVSTVAAFLWLLIAGYIQPLAVLLLELYLSF